MNGGINENYPPKPAPPLYYPNGDPKDCNCADCQQLGYLAKDAQLLSIVGSVTVATRALARQREFDDQRKELRQREEKAKVRFESTLDKIAEDESATWIDSAGKRLLKDANGRKKLS